MSPAGHEKLRKNDVTREGRPSHRRRAHPGLRAGASPERPGEDGNRGCRNNPCPRDDGPIDCKTQSVRRRLAEELGCCGCPKPETACLVTEGENTCCRRRPAAPSCPAPNASPAAAAYVDPVDQIVNEGLMQAKKKSSSRRRSSCCGASRPRDPSGRERGARPSTANNSGYQPDFFDDRADMSNWQQHRESGRRDMSRARPSTPPPRPRCLAFEPHAANSPASARGTPGAVQPTTDDENDGRRQNVQRELQRLNDQRAYLVECLEREMKIIEMMREYKQLKRASAQLKQQPPAVDERERLQRLIDEEKRKLAEFQRRPGQQDGRCPATPTGTYEIPSDSPTGCPTPSPPRQRQSACASASAPAQPPRQRRRLSYQPPSPDTEDECCAPPPPRRRLLVVRPPSPDDSSDDGARCPAGPADGSRSVQESAGRPPSSLQDSFMYYCRAIRNGAPPVTADVPQQTSSTWSTCNR